MHFNIHDVFYSTNYPQHVSAGILAIRRVMLFYNTKLQIRLRHHGDGTQPVHHTDDTHHLHSELELTTLLS
jgi:hypothetical protein